MWISCICRRRVPTCPLVVELKWNRTADGAIRQIRDRRYPEVLEGDESDILLVGISYDEKAKRHECVMERV